MISLLAEMFITGVVDKGGHINQTLSTPRTRAGEHGPEYVIAWAEETHTKNEDLVITEVDVSNLIRAKAAIFQSHPCQGRHLRWIHGADSECRSGHG